MSTNKPAWLKDAVATTAGWVNPKTNELLASRRDLPDALPFVGGKIIWPEKKAEAPKVAAAQPKSKSEQKRKAAQAAPVEPVEAPVAEAPAVEVQETDE